MSYPSFLAQICLSFNLSLLSSPLYISIRSAVSYVVLNFPKIQLFPVNDMSRRFRILISIHSAASYIVLNFRNIQTFRLTRLLGNFRFLSKTDFFILIRTSLQALNSSKWSERYSQKFFLFNSDQIPALLVFHAIFTLFSDLYLRTDWAISDYFTSLYNVPLSK